ncbi:aldo/keto reductase [Lewinella cohaerens]|uniref:aldo/keto reductase n=1 Tax=Lewinella cohaerens TaxID=70995 RepID=UPI00037DF5CE|nr:aldo/keto reductase [Lewinella cohaerens]
MKHTPIGRSGLMTSPLTLGSMLFGEKSERTTPEPEAQRIMDHYLATGGNHIDTANVYAEGRSEEIIGRHLGGKRQQVILSTKVRFPMGEDPNQSGLSRLHIIESVHDSLRRLNTDYIDLLYLHCWDPITPLAETLRALDDLVSSGKVRYLGISNFKAWQLMKAQGMAQQSGYSPFIAAQYQYSLVKRDLEYEFADLCATEGLGLLPWGPLGGGFLSGKYTPDQQPTEGRIATTADHTEESWERRNQAQNWEILAVVDKIAKARNSSHVAVALAWLLHKEIVPSVIIGARTFVQLEQNLEAATLELSTDEMAQLDEVSKLPELYPYRMIEAYGGRN